MHHLVPQNCCLSHETPITRKKKPTGDLLLGDKPIPNKKNNQLKKNVVGGLGAEEAPVLTLHGH